MSTPSHQTFQIINSYPKEGLEAGQVEEMIAGLARLLGLTHWLMIQIQQKLLNIYISEVSIKLIVYHLEQIMKFIKY